MSGKNLWYEPELFKLKESKYTMQNTLTIKKSNMRRQNNYMITCVSLFIALIFFIGCKKEDITPPDPDPVDPPVLVIEKANYYVAPDGNDANPGTIDKPFKNWDKIIKIIKPGDLVYLRGGTYYKSGLSGSNACYFVGYSGKLYPDLGLSGRKTGIGL